MASETEPQSQRVYFALIGDLVKSKEISDSDRVEFQESFKKSLATINSRNSHLASPYTLSVGDEFQALYHDCSGIFLDVIDLMIDLYPVQVRIGIGIGSITTKINQNSALGMDGTAFHNAREAIEKMGKRFDMLIEDPTKDLSFFNDILSIIVNGWYSARGSARMQVFRDTLFGMTPDAIARKHHKNPSSIYDHIKRGAINQSVNILHSIEQQLAPQAQ